MENSYGIGTRNRYELFLSEEDPLEILKAQEQEKEAKKKTKLNEKENRGKNEVPGKPAQAVRKGIKETSNIKTADFMKVKEESRTPSVIKSESTKPKVARPSNDRISKPTGESREERNNRRNREERPAAATADFGNRDGNNRAMEGGGDYGRGRGGRGATGRGMGRGRGRGRGMFDSRGKREFDRQSGSDKSGVKPMDKREGGGAHNWGTYRDEIDDQMNTSHAPEPPAEWNVEKPEVEPVPAEPQETKEVGGGGDADNQLPPEEGPQELTLDEWKALRGNRQKPTFNIRKAGEGEDMTQWKKMYALKKKEGEEEDEEEEEYDASEYPQRVGRQKHLLDIDIHFADSRRGTRGRGRGGMRGGAGRAGASRGGPGRMGGGSPRVGGPPGGGRGPVGPGGDAPMAAAPGASSGGGSVGAESPGRAPVSSDGQPRSNAISSRVRQSAPKVDDENDFPSLG
ncbi:plasminogen activator inhibitor 1 RNA-binding protein-like [Ischnura elegans]|uniref:plasminogen activator inhibitor 1 RNA-binding protein-like n=1 Tax=Ischnura elegans TaxID=197161 RepID=UPI001ED887E7|nr:plasminogen activator inhibitor 1 RNA-binding protein-like [Ischnura elegans]XP_046405801.1 plasminogen activator inhibitor 1 RNA-binding protein-like [Ischnura elegans]